MRKLMMKISPRRMLTAGVVVTGIFLSTGCGGVTTGSKENAFPSKPVELVVPYSAGGGSDLQARALGRSLEGPLGETLVVVNKPGGGGNVGTAEVASATSDGYKLVMPNATQFTVSKIALPNEQSVGLDDLTVIRGLTRDDVVLYTSSNSPYRSIADLLALSGSDKAIRFASNGPSSILSLSQVIFYGKAKIKTNEVPFGGVGEQLPAILGGHVDVGAATYSELASQVGEGGVRILGVFSKERLTYMPDVPTFAEFGMDLKFAVTRFLAGPADLPEDVTKKLNDSLTEVFKSEEWAKILEERKLERHEVDGQTIVQENEDDFTTYEIALADIGWTPKA
jgi:tripartite-type tricarboxylate transporter receptor subunit TctC